MWTWVVIVGGYGISILGFRLVGGVGAAGEAISRWGRRCAERAIERGAGSPNSFVRSRLGR
jgi:uncharacterized protein GlcG (DUF336 family)